MKLTVCRGLFFVLGLACLVGCQRLPFGKGHHRGPVIARVGPESITAEDLRLRLLETPPAYQQYVASAEGRRQFLNLLIREKVLLSEAKTLGVPRDPAFRQALERYRQDAKRREREYENTLMVESVLRRLRSKDLAVTDSDVQRYYEDHRSDYQKPLEIQASHILVPTETQAGEVLSRLKAGEPFEKLARELSKDPATASRGGALGPFRRGNIVPEFEEVAFRLKNGEVSGPVKTQFGFHIIKKLGQKSLPPRLLEEAKEEIRAKLERDKFDQWVNAKQAVLGIRVDEQAVAHISQEPPKP